MRSGMGRKLSGFAGTALAVALLGYISINIDYLLYYR
jgi:hypothetical protein